MVTTTWNAPEGAFTLEDEIINQTCVDDGVLFGFHKTMEYTGLKKNIVFIFIMYIKIQLNQ